MSTPENAEFDETTDHTGHHDNTDRCGPCPECEAAWDAHDVAMRTIDLGLLALLFVVLHLATVDLAGGWTDWSYVAAGILAACTAHTLLYLIGPAMATTRRAIARLIQTGRDRK